MADNRARDPAATPASARAALNDLMRACAAIEVTWRGLEEQAREDAGARVALEHFEDRARKFYRPVREVTDRLQKERDQSVEWTRIAAVVTLLDTAHEHFSRPTGDGPPDDGLLPFPLLVQVLGSRLLLATGNGGHSYTRESHRALVATLIEQWRTGVGRDEIEEPLRWALTKASEERGLQMKVRRFAEESLGDITGASSLIRKAMQKRRKR